MRGSYEQIYANTLDNLEEMEKSLEAYNLVIQNHEKEKNLKRLIISKENESIIKIPKQTKIQDQMASLVNSAEHLKKN